MVPGRRPRTLPVPCPRREAGSGRAREGGRAVRALVVYESMFGNTAMAAAAIAESLERNGATVQLEEVSQASEVIPEDLDLLLGGGSV